MSSSVGKDGPWATAVVVLYNTKIEDSLTLSTLREYSDQIKTIICDNSTIDVNANRALWKNVQYLDMGGNKGLAAAYNRALNLVEGDCVCIFDDDSEIDSQYFSILKEALNNDAWDIALPIVYSGNRIISPSKMTSFRCRPINSPYDRVSPKRISGINSGMAVRVSVYNICKYNRRLFLDFIDHDFCRRAIQNKCKVVFMPSMKISQRYSFDCDDCENALSRIRIFEKDAREYYKRGLLRRAYCMLMVIRRKILMAFRYKCAKFITGA